MEVGLLEGLIQRLDMIVRLLGAWEVRAQARAPAGTEAMLPTFQKPASALSRRAERWQSTVSWVKSLTRRIMRTMVH